MKKTFRSPKLDRKIELFHGTPVGNGMKGVVIDGELISWYADVNYGRPYHDDVDRGELRSLQLTNYASELNEIEISGAAPPLDSPDRILQMFSGYGGGTHIGVDIKVIDVDELIYLSFRDTVAQFRSLFRSNPPPTIKSYRGEIKRSQFLIDYDLWTKTFSDSKTAQQALGRGGRDDAWQEKDEDWSKSFSAYNPKKRKSKR